MNRRNFLIATSGATIANAASAANSAVVLYGDRAATLREVRSHGEELWVRSEDLPRIDEFELKPQGACRADMCIPVPKELRDGDWFHLTGFARKVGEAFAADAGVWSFGEIPVVRGSFLKSRIAPDFAAPDRTGRPIHLSDFRGKKTLVLAWASW